MNGWLVTGIIVLGLFVFFGIMLPFASMMWSWANIWEDQSEIAQHRMRGRSKRATRGFDS
jgi:hypothetical protein